MKKILIVDDEINNRLLLEEILEDLKEEGVQILLAEEGQQALDIIKAEKPNIVFLDIMIPIINGYEVCNIVKKQWNLSEVYIVLLTARGQAKDKDMGKEVLADKYITKPFYFKEVLEVAEEVLK